MARQPHKTAHPDCPFANWAACEKAQAMRFGQCRAMVDHKTGPVPCTRWAVSEKGWCGQHYASEIERERRTTREAERKAELNARIDAHIAMTQADPWWWLKFITPSRDAERGLRPFFDRDTAPPAPRRGRPFRLTEPV